MKVKTLNPDKAMGEAAKNSQRLVDDLRALLVYKEIVTGKGLEFERLRKYVPGDEARMIDWNSLARTNKLYTKIFKEERMLDVIFVVDVSQKMTIGSTERIKNEYSSVVSATLARTALEAGDKVGLIAFSDEIKTTLEPSYNDESIYEFVKELSDESIYGGNPNWNVLKKQVLQNFGHDTFVFVLSDFVGDSDEMYDFLLQCNQKFRGVFCNMVRDPLDSRLPEGVGKAYISDPGTGEISLVDVDEIREEYNENARKQESQVEKKVESSGGHFFKIHTDEDFAESFAKHLDRRATKWK